MSGSFSRHSSRSRSGTQWMGGPPCDEHGNLSLHSFKNTRLVRSNNKYCVHFVAIKSGSRITRHGALKQQKRVHRWVYRTNHFLGIVDVHIGMHNNLKTDTKMYAAVVEVTTLVDPFSHTQEPFSAWSAMLNYF